MSNNKCGFCVKVLLCILTKLFASGAGACSLHPFTLRTLRTCTVFRLTISRLEAFLEGLQPEESADVRERLYGAMQMDRGMGHNRYRPLSGGAGL